VESAVGDAVAPEEAANGGTTAGTTGDAERDDGDPVEPDEPAGADEADEPAGADEAAHPETISGHVRAVIGSDSGRVRLLDDAFSTVDDDDAGGAFDLVAEADEAPTAVVLDGALDQRLLDVAAQRGVGQVVAASTGEFVKQPTSVRVRTGEELLAANEP
ncbi:hypothetical protein BRD11_04290, partial [Halobacteriales archaeon SW_12_69_24]